MKQVHLFISGFVHGVGFRRFVKHHAEKLGLKGWTRNLSEGRIEVLVQSSAGSDKEDKKKPKELIKVCSKGPFLSEVKSVSVEWEDPQEEFPDFKIKPTE